MGFTRFSALRAVGSQHLSLEMPDININSVRNILKALEENWFKSDNEVANKCAHLLKSALSEEIEVPHHSKCTPPSGLCMEAKDREDQGLMQTLYMSWNGLGWTIAPQFKLATNNRIKEARLIGPYVGTNKKQFNRCQDILRPPTHSGCVKVFAIGRLPYPISI